MFKRKKEPPQQYPSIDEMMDMFNNVGRIIHNIMQDPELSDEQKFANAFHTVRTCSSFAFAAAIKGMYNPESEERWLAAVDMFSEALIEDLPQQLKNTASLMSQLEFES